MKTTWKIILGVVLAITVIFAFIFYRSEMMPPIDSGPPSIEPAPEPIREEPGSVDKLLDEMEFGVIAFNSPTHINIENSSQIQLLLSLADTMEKLKQSISEEGEKIGATIEVTDRMEARLSGYMFQITAITHETQVVSRNQQTEWKWEIHPKKEGKHKLHLTLTAFLKIEGQSTPRAIRTFDKNIEVTVTIAQKIKKFILNQWQWLWAAILVPFVGWLWNRKKTAKKGN